MRTHRIFILVALFVGCTQCKQDTFCKYPQLDLYSSRTHYPVLDPAEYISLCRPTPTQVSAIIKNGVLTVDGCQDRVQYKTSHADTNWETYTEPTDIKDDVKYALVRCGEDGPPILAIRPADVTSKLSSDDEMSPEKKNVFVVMLDAMSHEAIQRYMPQTVKLLKNHMVHNVYSFSKYSTVGLNSNPNKFAVMGRMNYVSIMEQYWRTKTINTTWIWEFAKKQGYLTLVAEDACPKSETWDIMNVLTDRDIPNKPDFTLLEQFCIDKKAYKFNDYCLHDRFGYEYIIDYTMDMLSEVEESGIKQPVFSWTNFVEAHEVVQFGAKVMDPDVVKYLRRILNSPLMKNGVLYILADHGLHFGDYGYSSVLGMTENRHPFLYVVTGKDVGDIVSDSVLTTNQDRLVSPYDIYTSMVSLIGEDSGAPVDPRDFNILKEEVKLDRTCDMADIPAEWCLCTYGPTCDAAGVPPRVWNKCLSQYIHPDLFDSKYYIEHTLKPAFGGKYTECEAIRHWCAFGIIMGWNGTDHFSLRQHVAANEFYKNEEYCWAWPLDCNWANVINHYFQHGYLLSNKRG